MSEGQAFQFTLGGMQRLGDGGEGLVPTAEVIPHAQLEAEPAAQPFAAKAPKRKPKEQTPGSGPGAVLKAAKARIKALKRELRQVPKLEKELAELERLVAAAEQKPTPKVRPLRSTG